MHLHNLRKSLCARINSEVFPIEMSLYDGRDENSSFYCGMDLVCCENEEEFSKDLLKL